MAILYAGFVITRFSVRADGRTPFQYATGARYDSPLCEFGESIFGLIPDANVWAAKLSNRWVRGVWWGRDPASDEHLVGTKFGVLKCRSLRRRPPHEQWSQDDTREAKHAKWDFDPSRTYVAIESEATPPTFEQQRRTQEEAGTSGKLPTRTRDEPEKEARSEEK